MFDDLADYARFRRYFIGELNKSETLKRHEEVLRANTDLFRKKLGEEARVKKGVVNMTNFYNVSKKISFDFRISFFAGSYSWCSAYLLTLLFL